MMMKIIKYYEKITRYKNGFEKKNDNDRKYNPLFFRPEPFIRIIKNQ